MPKILRIVPCLCLFICAAAALRLSCDYVRCIPGGTAGASAPGSGGITQTGGTASAGGITSTNVSKPVGGTEASGGVGGVATASGGAISVAGTFFTSEHSQQVARPTWPALLRSAVPR